MPASVVAPPLIRLEDLPPIGGFRFFLYTRAEANPAARTLADHVEASFRDLAACGARMFA